jgi:hypothetical protein
MILSVCVCMHMQIYAYDIISLSVTATVMICVSHFLGKAFCFPYMFIVLSHMSLGNT